MRQDLYEKAGLEGERIVFLLTDTQITHEAFLEVGLPPGSAQERCVELREGYACAASRL
jgi:hypothetical protein